MSFAWPVALAGLLAVPALAAAYAWQLRRRRRRAVRYSSVALIRAAGPPRSNHRRHLPAMLLLAALACLSLAAARPQVRTDVPVSGSAVILALDVSGSMCATDADPNRLGAAQAAVRQFVTAQDSGTRIGLVVFSGFAQLAVTPTTDRRQLLQTIDTLTTGRGTTIGAAVLTAVDAISRINPDVAPAGGGPGPGGDSGPLPPGRAPAVRPGHHAPEIVVLLTDGANTAGISPQDAARVAAARGVRVYPIGFGTSNPTRLVCTAEQLGGLRLDRPDRFGGGGPGLRNFLVADEGTLREVAGITGGRYFTAAGADQLQDVLRELPRQVDVQQRDVELSAGLAGLAVLLVVATGWAAVRWSAFPS
jgi:Ca-activated chloride channel family protein